MLQNPKILTSPPSLDSKYNPWEYIHSGREVLPTVLQKVHHRPEPRYLQHSRIGHMNVILKFFVFLGVLNPDS